MKIYAEGRKVLQIKRATSMPGERKSAAIKENAINVGDHGIQSV
jgi:hypothetical protein